MGDSHNHPMGTEVVVRLPMTGDRRRRVQGMQERAETVRTVRETAGTKWRKMV